MEKKSSEELFKVKDLRLAAIRYYDDERGGVELTDAVGYVILEGLREDFYVNAFNIFDSTPVFERVPYSNTTLDGEDFGSKLRLVTYNSKTGPCYVLTKVDLSCYFKEDVVTKKQLEDYILYSKYYFRDRKDVALKSLKKHPIKMLKILQKDAEKEKKFNSFFEERDCLVFKK